jgi:stearoyl-CoA desaturase (delta-9 desaturase)
MIGPSVTTIALAAAAWWLAALLLGLGNTVGYHRLLTHRSFHTGRAVRWFWTLLGAMHSGSPLFWVGLHRLHHTKSDGPDDPHSPTRGFWWGHAGWIIGVAHPVPAALFAFSGFGQQAAILWMDLKRLAGRNPPVWRGICTDLMEDPLMRALDVPLVMPALFAAQLAAAWLVGGGWGVLWLWSLHLVLTNTSWGVNSICHWPTVGVAPFENRDQSRDVWWFAYLTNGEAYHNGHHRWPRSAKHALHGGSDLSWQVIRLMCAVGLARDPWLPKAFRAGAPATE